MSDFYEDQTILSEYLSFHYGSPEQLMPWDFGPKSSTGFPERIAHQFRHHYPSATSKDQKLRALDIGCAVGRSTLELTRCFDSVHGIDFSNAFIQAAQEIASNGSISCKLKTQGKQFMEHQFDLPDGVNPDRAHFQQGDAMNLGSMNLGSFDLVLASNLICRLPDPTAFLESIPSLMNTNGVFVLSTPYTFLEEFTPVDRWIGGQADGPTAEQAVFSLLSKNLDLLEQTNIPMLIREHYRKYQWTVCQVSAWKFKN